MISILTFNAALQDVRFLGQSFYRPVDFVQDRLAELTKQLKILNADIICLQEFFQTKLQEQFYASLTSLYPYVTGFAKAGFKLRLGNELLILSKFPLKDGKLTRFTHTTIEERFFTSKGMYRINVEIPGMKALQLINFHMTAGGLRNHPEDQHMDAIRSAQIRQLLESVPKDIPVLLAGDLNAGPDSSKINYQEMLQAGLIDAFANGNGSGITWDPENPLVASNKEHHLLPQRIDHIFLNKAGAGKLAPVKSCIVLNGTSVRLPDGRLIPVSDHYGVRVDFNIS